jgi:hypothetical protein
MRSGRWWLGLVACVALGCGSAAGGGGAADATGAGDGGTVGDSAGADADGGQGGGDVSATDAAADAAADAATDAEADAAADAAADVATDAAADATTDAAADATTDAAADAATTADADTDADTTQACLPWSGGCVEPSCLAIAKARTALVAEIQAQGAKPCAAKADCTTLDVSTACQGACPLAVHKDTVGPAQTKLTSFSVGVCQAFDAAGKCGYATPGCLAPDPTCEDGVCVYAPTKPVGACAGPQPPNTVCKGGAWVCAPGAFQATAGGACQQATCATMQQALSALVADLIDAAKSCQSDSDCVLVDVSTACQGACPAAINGDMKADTLAALAAFDEGVCKAFDYAAMCGYSTPKCMAPKLSCQAGSCVAY